MSIKVMTWYWDNSKQDGHKLLLLLALADWSNDDGECFPRISRLAERFRRKRRATQNAIKELEKEGELLVYPGMGKGSDGKRSSLYYLLKYRQSLELDIPPMITEAASYYRQKSRKQGTKGIRVRKSQVSLLEETTGVQSSTPLGVQSSTPLGVQSSTPLGVQSSTPLGVQSSTPLGVQWTAPRSVIRIRHKDPSEFEPSAATPPIDDDDALSAFVKVDRRGVRNERADQDAELSGLRRAADRLNEETLGTGFDGWARFRDGLCKEQLRLFCYWCKAAEIKMSNGKVDQQIGSYTAMIRAGVEREDMPGLPPFAQQSVDEYLQLEIEIAQSGVRA